MTSLAVLVLDFMVKLMFRVAAAGVPDLAVSWMRMVLVAPRST